MIFVPFSLQVPKDFKNTEGTKSAAADRPSLRFIEGLLEIRRFMEALHR